MSQESSDGQFGSRDVLDALLFVLSAVFAIGIIAALIDLSGYVDVAPQHLRATFLLGGFGFAVENIVLLREGQTATIDGVADVVSQVLMMTGIALILVAAVSPHHFYKFLTGGATLVAAGAALFDIFVIETVASGIDVSSGDEVPDDPTEILDDGGDA